MKKLCILGYPKSKCTQWRFQSACADLNLRWAHMSEGTFSDVEAQYVLKLLHYHIISPVYIYSNIRKIITIKHMPSSSKKERACTCSWGNSYNENWSVAQHFLQDCMCACAHSENSDYPHILIWVFAGHFMDSQGPYLFLADSEY